MIPCPSIDGRRLWLSPDSRHVVPGEVRMTLDIRHPDSRARNAMEPSHP